MDLEGLSPRQLAGIVEENYGPHLSFQEALVFYLLVRAEGLVTYAQIEEYLWAEDRAPLSTRKLIHVVISRLRHKLPMMVFECVRGQGYKTTVNLADVDAGLSP